MQYRRVGSSGLKVSAVSLGGWLTFGGGVDGAATERIVRAALERGVNFIDLADVYASGRAEEAVGAFLPGLRRASLVISSKCFWPMGDGPNDRGLSRKHIIESCEASLRRLGTDYLDLYFCHREDPDTPLDETARAMDDLVRQGKVLYWGTSCWKAGTLAKVHALAGLRGLSAPIVEQPQYNLLTRDIEKRVMPVSARLGMGLVVFSPLAGGALTGKYLDGRPAGSRGATSQWLDRYLAEENLPKLRRFVSLARDHGVTPAQLALAWCLRRPEVSSVITGASRVEHVEDNVAAVEVEVSDAVDKELGALFKR